MSTVKVQVVLEEELLREADRAARAARALPAAGQGGRALPSAQ